MASKNQQPAPETAANPVTPLPTRPPAGFIDEGRPDIDGWLKAVEGLVVHGKIVGYFSFIQRQRDGTDKVREAICVRLLQPVAAMQKNESVQLEKGQVLAMGLKYCLQPLKLYVENRGEIWVQFKNQAPIGGGQTVWKANVFGKGTKAAAPLAVTQPLSAPVVGAPVEESEPWDS